MESLFVNKFRTHDNYPEKQIRKPMKSIILRISFLALLSLLRFTTVKAEQTAAEAKVAVKESLIESFIFCENLFLMGTCEIAGSRNYYAEVSGRIDFITDKQTQHVEQDEVILTIDKELAEALKHEAEIVYNNAKSAHSRNLELYSRELISKEKLEQSEVACEQAKLVHMKAQMKYASMVMSAKSSGALTLIDKKVGDFVREGEKVFEIINDAEKIISAELPENIFLKKIDIPLEVYVLNANGTKTQARVLNVSNCVSDCGTVTVKVSVPRESKILYGSLVELQVLHNKHRAMGVPEKAILRDNTGSFVYTISAENKVKKTYVNVGKRSGDVLEIFTKENIGIGTRIVIEGLTKVSDGASVVVTK